MQKNKMKSKPLTLKQIKKKAWDMFSRYIRLRDCLKTTGRTDMGKCKTCGRLFLFKNLQAGHSVPGRRSATLFDETCTNAQCVQCNIFKSGNLLEYRRQINKMYGEGHNEMLEQKSRGILKYYFNDYFLLLKLYERKIKELKKG